MEPEIDWPPANPPPLQNAAETRKQLVAWLSATREQHRISACAVRKRSVDFSRRKFSGRKWKKKNRKEKIKSLLRYASVSLPGRCNGEFQELTRWSLIDHWNRTSRTVITFHAELSKGWGYNSNQTHRVFMSSIDLSSYPWLTFVNGWKMNSLSARYSRRALLFGIQWKIILWPSCSELKILNCKSKFRIWKIKKTV